MVKRLFALGLLAVFAGLFASLLSGYVPDAALNPTARYYAERTAPDLGAANLVTAIIITYRGLDTLGEVTVLFLAAAIVGLVLGSDRGSHRPGPEDRTAGRPDEAPANPSPPVGELLTTGSRLLVPLILLLGVYVFANGHRTPGGGFQGGAILASATLLLLLAKPGRQLSHRLIAALESLAGLLFIIIGLLGLALAGGFLDNRILPLGTLGALFSAGAIPLISALIGLKVGAEFSSILASLAETRQAQAGRVEPVGDTPAAWVQPDRDNPGAAHKPTGPATTADREQP
ncbi:MAG: sodium:proton antiporter [Gammaproteobacteria bacterium]|jgi:multicomponent Na+:H+ antiporter subunit B|nr:sodium:proton antiporter [Gammaproteobacteria bacterium]